MALARLSAGSRGSGGDVVGADTREVSSPVLDVKPLKVEDRHDSMRDMAFAGRTDLDNNGGDEKGESSRSAAAIPSPVPVPVPVLNPVFVTTTLEPPATTAQLEEVAAVSEITAKSINHDGVSSPESDREDPIKRDERSAVERFANDWDTTVTRDKRKGSVSSLSSTDLDDEDSDDEGGVSGSKDSLGLFEKARSEADRAREPPRADEFEGEEEGTSMLDRPRPIARDVNNGEAAILTGGVGTVRARPERTTSPYRGSRFSENFDAV